VHWHLRCLIFEFHPYEIIPQIIRLSTFVQIHTAEYETSGARRPRARNDVILAGEIQRV
jgi:hypothetical protein